MAYSVNKVIIVGNAGRDAEMRYSASGQPQTQFSVATSRSFKKDEEWQEETTWFNVTVWGNRAESAANNIKKGSKVYVEGRLRTYEVEKEGVKQYRWEVVADQAFSLSGKAEQPEGTFAAPSGGFKAPDPTSLDDLPF